MIEIQRTTRETLDTPEAIAVYLADAWRSRSEAAPFRQGDVVRATSRQGLPADLMIGEVGVVLVCDPAAGLHTTVLCLHRTGILARAEVQTADLVRLER